MGEVLKAQVWLFCDSLMIHDDAGHVARELVVGSSNISSSGDSLLSCQQPHSEYVALFIST